MNERLETVYVACRPDTREFICECADPECTDGILLSATEYQHVRDHPTRFAIASGHERHQVERVISAGEQFTVVEKPFSP